MKFTEEQREKIVRMAVELHGEFVKMFGDKFSVSISCIDSNYIHICSAKDSEGKDDSITLWDKEIKEYEERISKEDTHKRMTLRQLTEWLSKGNGEYTTNGGVFVSSVFGYKDDIGDNELYDCFYIRRFGKNEWIEPTYEVYKEDCLNG